MPSPRGTLQWICEVYRPRIHTGCSTSGYPRMGLLTRQTLALRCHLRPQGQLLEYSQRSLVEHSTDSIQQGPCERLVPPTSSWRPRVCTHMRYRAPSVSLRLLSTHLSSTSQNSPEFGGDFSGI